MFFTGHISKAPEEAWTFAVKYDGRLPPGTTIVSGTVEARNADTGVIDSSVVGSLATTVDDSQVKVVLLGGESGKDYSLKFRTVLSDNATLIDFILLKVIN